MIGDPLPAGFKFMGEPCRANGDIGRRLIQLFCRGADWARFIVIDGEPESKQRPRYGRGPVRARLRASFDERITGNVAVACVFFRASRQKIDADNLLKNIIDAGTGICWHDDSQITAMAGFIELDADNPRTILVIGPHDSTMLREGPLLSSRIFTCGVCNSIFQSKQSHTPKYCSQECTGKARRVITDIECPQCRKLFKRRTTSQKFCSHPCKVIAFRDVPRKNKSKRPDCRICGKRLSRLGYVLCRTCWASRATSAQPDTSEFDAAAKLAFKSWTAA